MLIEMRACVRTWVRACVWVRECVRACNIYFIEKNPI